MLHISLHKIRNPQNHHEITYFGGYFQWRMCRNKVANKSAVPESTSVHEDKH